MSHRRCGLVACGVLASGLTGCAVLLVGAGAAGGYAISKDSIRSHFDLAPRTIYQESRRVIGERGLVTLEDERRGLIKAQVEGATVTITVKRISERTTELNVKARDNLLLPKIEIAQAIYNEIITGLH